MTPFATFGQEVYAMSKRFGATQLPPAPRRRGRQPALSRAAVLALALALLRQLQRFRRERDVMRYAQIHLRALPAPPRSQPGQPRHPPAARDPGGVRARVRGAGGHGARPCAAASSTGGACWCRPPRWAHHRHHHRAGQSH
jgi:hypothetical protein